MSLRRLDDTFTGNGKENMPDFQPIFEQEAQDSYIVSPELRRAVQVAILLGQPILLTGEPGTGKTQLARHIANVYLDNNEVLEKRFFIFNTKTTSLASDLFYRYESLKHFQYIQNHKEELSNEKIDNLFIKYQALGKAIKAKQRCVVLIDEIDKAPRDLPNDILDVMEHLSFEVPEIGAVGHHRIKADTAHRPIVVMTSNSEKNLPDAFLRRCVFFHIPFPSPKILKDILKAKTNATKDDKLLDLAIEHFQLIRKTTRRKKPSTAEFIQWMTILKSISFDLNELVDVSTLSDNKKQDLLTSYTVLVKDKEDKKAAITQVLKLED